MKLINGKVIFENYRSCSPSMSLSSFTDEDGSTLLINTKTLIRMYDIVKWDLGEHCMSVLEEEILKGDFK